jgi:SAM-dependent methyltransferase
MAHKENFDEQRRSFGILLSQVNVEAVSPELFCKKYLTYLLQHKTYFLEVYADVLQKLLACSPKNKAKTSLLDFGAGNGLLGIFAKYCGFQKVYINDIDAHFVAAAKTLALQLKIDIDGFVTGDADSLPPFFGNDAPDVIVGTDVIEHIYDLNVFFGTLKRLNPAIVSVFTTASNPANVFKIRRLQRLQRKDELEGGTPEDAVLFGAEPHESYLKIRQDLIRKNFSQLSEDKIQQLATVARGLAGEDILTFVKAYLQNGKLPPPLTHPTNTCHPLTGSWTERILSIDAYTQIYNNAGFELKVDEGFYDVHKPGVKGIVNQVLNIAIMILGKTFAPYILLTGSKK